MKPYYEHAGITIYHGDCRDILPGLEMVDLVLTDPPYGIGKDLVHAGDRGGKFKTGDIPEWDCRELPTAIVQAITTGAFSAQAIVWGGNYYEMPRSRCWLLWDKVQIFTGADAELAWTNVSKSVDVFHYLWFGGFRERGGKAEQFLHPTQKPVRLAERALKKNSEINDIVIDAFAGSGSTLIGCEQLIRICYLIELDPKFCDVIIKRWFRFMKKNEKQYLIKKNGKQMTNDKLKPYLST